MARLKKKAYRKHLHALQLELADVARWVQATGQRLVVVVEGRDAAGKGGTINAIREHLNPRQCRVAALPKPHEREKTEWYFQRYVRHLPAAGEIVLFDRSWYNRAGVERVMGFATEAQVQAFLRQTPLFEKQLVDDGLLLFKYWLCCDQDRQEKRFAERREDPLKRWKLSSIDLVTRLHYVDYTAAREAMLSATHTKYAPWTLVDFNDQRRGHLTVIQDFLRRLPDTHCADTTPDLPPFAGKLEHEQYGVLEPIPSFEG
jgi:polyphosphate kinase 2